MAGPEADVRARVRDYLLAQGEKYTFLDLWPRVMAGRLDLLDAIGSVTDDQAAFKATADDWSIGETCQHALESSRGVQAMVARLAAGESIRRDAEPGRVPPVLPWPELRRALLDDSVALAGLVASLPEPPSFDALAPHPFFGDLHARAWFLFQRVHDQDHAAQARAATEAPGYPA